MTERIKGLQERHERESVKTLRDNALIMVQEIYQQCLVDTDEALPLMRSAAAITSVKDVAAFEDTLAREGVIPLLREEHFEENLAHIPKLREEFTSHANSLTADNWQDLCEDFFRKIDLPHPSGLEARLIQAWAARLLEKAYYSSPSSVGKAEHFGSEVERMLSRVGSLPAFLYRDDTVMNKKRQPSFVESVESTLEHFAFIERLPETLGDKVEAILVGGSMSYGPFFNIRKNIDQTGSSDVDAIMVMSPLFLKSEGWESFSRNSLFEEEDTQSLLTRLPSFIDLQARGEVDVFSQRFGAPGKDFNMSAHFFPRHIFEAMTGEPLRNAIEARVDTVMEVRDFKPKHLEHSATVHSSFDGSTYAHPVPVQTQTNGGCIARIPGFIIRDRKFFPGLYHNLISPEFSVLSDSTGATSASIQNFQRLMLQELESVRQEHPGASLHASHPRSGVFAPERYEE